MHSRLRSWRYIFLHGVAAGAEEKLADRTYHLLRESFAQTHRARPFQVEAIVVMPDHLHCLWTLPPRDADFSMRWHAIKTAFSRGIPTGERLSARRLKKSERGIWHRRFWEHTIRDERDFERHADYIHFNPVKHGYASRAADWPFSSFHRYVEHDIYSMDWEQRKTFVPWI